MARRSRSFIDSTMTVFWIDTSDLFDPGHEVYRWAVDVGRDLEKSTKRTAPPGTSRSRWGHQGTGRLRAGISVEAPERIGPNEIGLTCVSKAPYTIFVHGGTAFQRGAFIYSNEGWKNKAAVDAMVTGRSFGRPSESMAGLYMNVPPGPGGQKRFLLRVRGQKANPFMIRGFNRMTLDHEAFTPFAEPVGY